jgi:hypothetical protein
MVKNINYSWLINLVNLITMHISVKTKIQDIDSDFNVF